MERNPYSSPAILSFGFRPFFFAAGLAAALLVPAWLALFFHGGALPSGMAALDWHIHEMIFGYLAAVVAGFLLTAIPNWTGRLPVRGLPLLVLFLLWLAGRFVLLLPVPQFFAAVVDSSFLVAMTLVAQREVLAGKNWRNQPVCLLLALYACGNIAFHFGQLGAWQSGMPVRAALSVLVILVALIGGRIVPSFSTNWLIKQGEGRRPVPFNVFDKGLLLFSVVALAAWVSALAGDAVTGLLLLGAGVGHLIRLVRWKGWLMARSAILVVLHAAYLWLPVGLLLLAANLLMPELGLTQSAGVHALTAGLMGMMPLAVMTRATLGHSGRDLAAGVGGSAVYMLAFLAASLRVMGALLPAYYIELVSLSGASWCLAFLLFVLKFGPMMLWARKGA